MATKPLTGGTGAALSGNARPPSRIPQWLVPTALVVVLVLWLIIEIVLRHAGPILKGRVEETLSTRFDSRVELASLDVSVLRGIEATGKGLRIFPPDPVVARGATQPLIEIATFHFHSGIVGLFFKPMHVRSVRVIGLQINIPPREMRQESSKTNSRRKGKIKIKVDDIVCDESRLIIGTSNPNKDPKDFELKHIVLHNVGPNSPWKFDAVLTNAVPRGEIHSTGSFGPWQTESPGDSSVNGHYTFEHADLNSINGIGGNLFSVGDFKGQLNKIVVDGTTETADFSLDTANHPVPLHTQFHAIVDGTTGDTYLNSIKARLHNSSFTTDGAVINIKGKGHRVNLNVNIAGAELADFLDLAVKTEPAIMTGLLDTRLKLQIRPGKQSVTQKLSFDGRFTLREIHFTNPGVQDKVDMLSLRARGELEKAKPGAADVSSQMNGTFEMANALIRFSSLSYVLPGARVNLEGIYSLDGQKFDFHGKVLTDASLWRMVDSRWRALLVMPISPFFHREGGGAEIPVSISGTKSEPKFGLDVFGHHK
jgi:hypothetical protein